MLRFIWICAAVAMAMSCSTVDRAAEIYCATPEELRQEVRDRVSGGVMVIDCDG
jgi:hypothetical protein